MGLLGGILGGLGGIIGSVITAHDNAKAISKATAAQQAGINRAIDEQQRQFDLTRSDYAPYLSAGTGAIGNLGDLLGINGPDQQAAALGVIQNSPVLARLIDQGTQGVLQNASATGGLRGGDTQRSLADFRADAFNQVLNDQLSRLGGLAGLGENATGSVSAFGANAANQIGSGLTSIGNSNFNSILGRQGVWNGLSNQIQSTIASIMSGGFGGGMGGGGGGGGGITFTGGSGFGSGYGAFGGG